jgi:hypothetical protein
MYQYWKEREGGGHMEERAQKTGSTVQNRGGEGSKKDEEEKELKKRRNKIREMGKTFKIPESITNNFRAFDGKYYFKDQKNTLAFEDKGKSITTEHNDDRVAKAVVKMAEAKGWRNIKVTGNETFRREVWLQAEINGIKVKGFTPRESDLALLSDHRKYNEKKLAVLKINHLDKSPQVSVLKAVAKEVLKAKVKNPKVRQAIMNEISHRLERSLLNGKQLPNVLMYGKNAKPRLEERSEKDVEKERSRKRDRQR